jgi:hypothetical protein
MSSSLGGNHRQRGTLRFVSYMACYEELRPGFAVYAGSVMDGDRHLGERNADIRFDRDAMTADEAVRADLCRWVDATVFGEGTPPDPAWVAARQFRRTW